MIDRTAMREAARRPPPPSTRTARFERAELAEGVVLGLDPTLGATGWALVVHREAELIVDAYGTLKRTVGKTAVERAEAGDLLLGEVGRLIAWAYRIYPELVVAHEEWPHAGGRALRDLSSSQQAGRVVRDAALAHEVPLAEMVHPQHHHHVMTGNRNASKDEVKLHLSLLAQSLPIAGYPATTNENVRDGISVALTTLYDTRS